MPVLEKNTEGLVHIMLIIFLLLMADYLFTYIGVKINLVEEANPIMRHIFDCDFSTGLILRTAYSLALITLLYIIKRKKPSYYVKIVIGTSVLYSIVMIMHIGWIALL